jgi:hypothetical protein
MNTLGLAKGAEQARDIPSLTLTLKKSKDVGLSDRAFYVTDD